VELLAIADSVVTVESVSCCERRLNRFDLSNHIYVSF
jgi:hypothetical protein